MSNEKNNRNLLVGTAVLAGLIGTLSAIRSNRPVQGWKEQAQDAAARFMHKDLPVNKNMLLGGVAAGLIGAAAALLFAPKAGSELLDDLMHPLSGSGKNVDRGSHKHSSAKHKKKTNSSSKKEAQDDSQESLHEQKSAKKRASREGKMKSSANEKNSTRRSRAKPSESASIIEELDETTEKE